MAGNGVYADDNDFFAGSRGCVVYKNVTGFVTCSNTDPADNIANGDIKQINYQGQDWLVTKMQCIESCRLFNAFPFASLNTADSSCQCLKELDSDLPMIHPYICKSIGATHEVYDVSALEPSTSCDNLYHKKHVFFWNSHYKINGINGACKYSLPSAKYGGKWNQKTEKLARNSLMFSDKTSREDPAQGVKVKYTDSGTFIELWSGSEHDISLPWRLDSGFRTGNDDSFLSFKFGETPRTAMIWGMQFMKHQVELIGGFPQFSIAYRYFKDVARGSSAADIMRSPVDIDTSVTKHDVPITTAEIDDNGLYFFKDPSNNQKPMIFIASEVFVKLNGGFVNFDFLGTFYDFQVASTGKNSDNQPDDWNTQAIGDFWIKGLFLKSFD